MTSLSPTPGLRPWYIGKVRVEGPLVLGPMAGYTSVAMRVLCRRAGAHLVCSEMVAAQGLAHGSEKSRALLQTCPQEKPVVVQLFGGEPEVVAAAVPWVEEAGADIVDINMGCPVPKVRKAQGGAALLSDPDRAVAMAKAVVERASVPVTCKIRAGVFQGDDSYLELARRLQDVGVAAIAVHGRTVQQGFRGEADHTPAARLVQALRIPVIASGDVHTATMPLAILEDTGCQGVMIARGALGRPWIFAQALAVLEGRQAPPDPGLGERLGLILCHAQMLALQFGEHVAVHEMRAHLAWYTRGVPHGAQLRRQCNEVQSLAALEALLRHCAHHNAP